MSPRAVRALGVIAASSVLMVLAGFVYLGGAHALTLRAGHTASPSPSARVLSRNCPTGQLELTGAFTQCVQIQRGSGCPASFDQPKVVQLHGSSNDFLLYIEIGGGAYRGPGTYQLRPWPHPALGTNDGIAKVAIWDSAGVQVWESTAGWLSVDGAGQSGSVHAGLWQGMDSRNAGSPVMIDLNLAGQWICP